MYNQGVILLSVVLTGLDYKIRNIPQIGGVNYTMPLPHTSRAQTQDCNFGQPRYRIQGSKCTLNNEAFPHGLSLKVGPKLIRICFDHAVASITSSN